MTFGERVYSLLTATGSPVRALVGGRVFAQWMKQGVELPAIVYAVVSDVPVLSLGGYTSGLRHARVQIDCYARKYADAQALADAVAGAVGVVKQVGFASTLLSRRDLYEGEPEPGMHRVSMEVFMAKKESA